MAPILSFTAEEIWQHMPGARGESVFLAIWHELPVDSKTDELSAESYWEKVLAVRVEVARELEKARVAGVIGASLEAVVDMYADAEWGTLLAKLGDELRFVFITSEAQLHDSASVPPTAIETAIPGLWAGVSASAHPKCQRCWHRRSDIGTDAAHPQLCGRCVENIDGAGERREFV